ncbi:MAG: hypothetical protein LBU34_12530 [Planctomycetaceae bacterium]|nr:hypothetical protein [Planctomycetaceae bacterium]
MTLVWDHRGVRVVLLRLDQVHRQKVQEEVVLLVLIGNDIQYCLGNTYTAEG